ncbi:MAG TPA: hypothetical protein PLU50_00070 [Pseudobdellovibrionaceae bacterium]|nr:hypothetical protein [Pseudobdellovibrionaceae bacterium]
MLKKLFMLVAFIVSGSTYANMDTISPTGKDWVPWPWSVRQPFPWNEIQGVWKTVEDEFPNYFVMRPILGDAVQKQMQVRVIDAKSCKVLATGIGVETDRGRNLRAQVTGESGTFFVAFTALSAQDARQKNSPVPGRRNGVKEESKARVVMASIRNLDNGKVSQVQIEKVTDPSEIEACEPR